MIKKFFYEGAMAHQSEKIDEVFINFLSKNQFDLIIEIGTFSGALTLFLADNFGGFVYTFDLNEPELLLSFNKRKNLFFLKEDVFLTKTLINILSNNNKRILLLCDGGNKIKEFNTFAKHLKYNDVIMAHDYFKTRAEHDPKKWKSCEIVFKDIESSCKLNKIEPYYPKFSEVFWFCGRKIK